MSHPDDHEHCELHFVGSVPLATPAEVISNLAGRFGPWLKRVPDGETGERIDWVQWQERVFEHHPQFEAVKPESDWRNPTAQRAQHRQFRPRAGAAATDLVLGELGYTRAAMDSYRAFAGLKREGAVPAACRFMVALPSPYNVVNWCASPEARADVEPAYEAALLDELARIAAAIPAEDLAIQWDCAHDMQAFDGARKAWFEPVKGGVIERLVRIGDSAPAGVELGYHLCYGSFGGRHFVEPKSTQAMVELTNGAAAGLGRPLDWVHMPVPIERDDDAYFAPLADLELRPETSLHLGLLHDQDGLDGTLRRTRAAERYVRDFGIATECGFGRRPPESLARLLDVHERVIRALCPRSDPKGAE